MNDTNSTAHPSAISSDWHRVGAGLSVRFSLRAEQLDAEWRTRPPTKREWKRVLERYRAARDAFAAYMAARRGVRIVVLEAPLHG